ncbi:MAG: response regulator [Agarilytica sp.]
MKIRILIVDETAFVRDALKRSIRRFLKDVEIHDAVNGNRALATLRTNKINLIISEWEMDEMSGRELLDWARKEEKYAKTPFIVTSDEGDRNLVMNAINAGANDFMAKPFSPDEVQKKVVKQLSRIGYKAASTGPAGQGTGFGSINVLTGGGAPKAKPAKSREVVSAAGFGKPAAKTAAKPGGKVASKPSTKTGNFDGIAHLHFKYGSIRCRLKELSLTGMSGTIERPDPDTMPSLFDDASANIENMKGDPIGELNVYVHALQSVDPRQDSNSIKITFRFGDNDPEQFEQLSKAVAKGR